MALLMSVGVLRIYWNRRWQKLYKKITEISDITHLSRHLKLWRRKVIVNKRVISWEREWAYVL